MISIYHNPRCSKSRQTLQLLEEKGLEPEVILYLETPLDKATLQSLLTKLAISPRQLLRKSEADYKDNELKNPELSDQQLIDFMLKYPKLIERPIVISNGKVRIGRPPESVLEIV